MKVELNKDVIRSAICFYMLKLKQDAQYWREAGADNNTSKELVAHCQRNEQEALALLADAENLVEQLQQGGACLADYKFYTEK